MDGTPNKQLLDKLNSEWVGVTFIVALLVVLFSVTIFSLIKLKKYCTLVRQRPAPRHGYNGPGFDDADDGYIDPTSLEPMQDNLEAYEDVQVGRQQIKAGPSNKKPMPAPRSHMASDDDDDDEMDYESITPDPRQSVNMPYYIDVIEDRAPESSTPIEHRGSNSQTPDEGLFIAGGHIQAKNAESASQVAVEDGMDYYSNIETRDSPRIDKSMSPKPDEDARDDTPTDADNGVDYYSDHDSQKTSVEGNLKPPSRTPSQSAHLGSDTSDDDEAVHADDGVDYYSDHDSQTTPIEGNLKLPSHTPIQSGHLGSDTSDDDEAVHADDGVGYYSDHDSRTTPIEGNLKLPSHTPNQSAHLGSDTSEDDSPQPVEGVDYYSDHDRENIRKEESKPKPPSRKAHQPEHREHPSVIQQAVRGDGDNTVSDADDEYINISPDTQSVISRDS